MTSSPIIACEGLLDMAGGRKVREGDMGVVQATCSWGRGWGSTGQGCYSERSIKSRHSAKPHSAQCRPVPQGLYRASSDGLWCPYRAGLPAGLQEETSRLSLAKTLFRER